MHYNPLIIEQAAQQFWAENQSFEVTEDSNKEKFYCLSMLPYPSGNLHMGHVRNYTIGDVIARYQKMQGKHVLHPIGWDAFGLPAENAAIQNKLPPFEWTHKNIQKMKEVLKQLGYSFSWQREITTCEPDYYRWEQWLFIQLFKKGLVYKKNAWVNWDPVDKTVLANEQVVDGRGWRSGAPVERREISQWFFKITEYADELLGGLDALEGNWPSQVCTMQRHWIGRSEGVNIHFTIAAHQEPLTIFTTRPDTLSGVTYLGIAPEHPLTLEAAQQDPTLRHFIVECEHTKMAEAEIATQTKKGFCLPFKAIHPLTQEELPIWVTNFVLMQYGSGAIMGVPAHDQRDFEFAQQYGLTIKPVIQPSSGENWDYSASAYPGDGHLIHSNSFNGLYSKDAIQAISDYLVENQLGEKQINYRLRDWGISRQRYWGTPIPMISCEQCGDIPVLEADLPVLLPTDLIPNGHGSPLKTLPSFYQTTCPHCHQPALRDTDTMDTFVESSWYYARYCSPNQNNAMLDDRAKYWTPINQYVGGVEHAVMHLLYARFMNKVLRDLGLLNSGEPFLKLLTQGMVLKDGNKMSKSKGNVVAPEHLMAKYGADTVRLFIIFAAPPEQSLEWSDSGVEGAYRFLKKLWIFAQSLKSSFNQLPLQVHNKSLLEDLTDPDLKSSYRQVHQTLQQALQDMERQQLNTVVSACMKIFNIMHKINPNIDLAVAVLQESMSILLRLLSPITPHIAHILWQDLAFGPDILQASWPVVNVNALQTGEMEMIVQVNGKLRGKIKVPSDVSDEVIQQYALQDRSVQRHLDNKPIKKVIVVVNKLINIVI